MNIHVSPYGERYSHRSPLMGFVEEPGKAKGLLALAGWLGFAWFVFYGFDRYFDPLTRRYGPRSNPRRRRHRRRRR